MLLRIFLKFVFLRVCDIKNKSKNYVVRRGEILHKGGPAIMGQLRKTSSISSQKNANQILMTAGFLFLSKNLLKMYPFRSCKYE